MSRNRNRFRNNNNNDIDRDDRDCDKNDNDRDCDRDCDCDRNFDCDRDWDRDRCDRDNINPRRDLDDCESIADLIFDLKDECCEDKDCSDCCECIECPKKSGRKCKKHDKHKRDNGRCYPSRDEKELCCDCNGGCKCYDSDDRNDFWPHFSHPRWLPCDCLYNS